MKKVKSAKYLGFILDENLRWDNHIEYTKEKISAFIGAIFRCRKFLSMGAEYKIYNSYILSIFRYIVPGWGNCGVTYFDKIQVL